MMSINMFWRLLGSLSPYVQVKNCNEYFNYKCATNKETHVKFISKR
jgi:hypothetical protein